ncbi:MAG: T9SS type A sorting domain-containing protein, partial [Gemmatimonadetes bacterium]|nr:T9SS type A sorting domain-containing protein [Gemmatimonadota bacterium]
TAPLTYSLSPALPAGLTFDAATRTIAGTPLAASETVYTYTVTDANGASLSLSLQTLPAAFSLADNFPNPFNPATTIQYALPQAADVELTVYNVLGQPVRTLIAEHQNAGRYVVEWDATNDSGHSLSSGMYFYRLQAGGEFHEVKKMLLLK